MTGAIPWRSDSGRPRPAAIGSDGQRLGLIAGGRPLKRWRYVGVFCDEVMICAAQVRIGPARQSFWALWDGRELRERTRLARGHRRVDLDHRGRLRVADADVAIDVELAEDDGVETICRSGTGLVWTRKQAGIAAAGRVAIDGVERHIDARAVIDDTAGYHERLTRWWWSAAVGRATDGRTVAWNLVAGVNDPPEQSERSVWVNGQAREVGPVRFERTLSRIEFAEGGELRFAAQATRRRTERLVVFSSAYVQPFGVFTGTLPGGIELAEARGVMEKHEARW